MSIPAGTLVGRYRIVRLIAQGGMAEVYRADQELTGGIYRPVALKVIRPEYTESQDFREMFLDEARTACHLSHPNIVHIYEVGDEDGTLYMAMELVPGESLANVARRLREAEDRLPDSALLAVGVFTCAALEAVHTLAIPGQGRLNLVHRDVSPHNLLLGATGSLKLIDFGIAKAVTNRNLTLPGMTKGKAGYFSPEQAMGKQLDGRSDLFSLGITLYKLAYGATPFDEHGTHQARNTALVAGKWRPLHEVCPGLPDGLYEIVDRSTKVKPDERYANAAEMRGALEQLAVDLGLRVGQSTLAGFVAPEEEPEPSPVAGTRVSGGAAKSLSNPGARLSGGHGAMSGPRPAAKVSGSRPAISGRSSGRATAPLPEGSLGSEDEKRTRTMQLSSPKQAGRRLPFALLAVGAVLAVTLVAAGAALLARRAVPADTAERAKERETAQAVEVAAGPPSIAIGPGALQAEDAGSAAGEVGLEAPKPQPPSPSAAKAESKPESDTGALRLPTKAWKALVRRARGEREKPASHVESARTETSAPPPKPEDGQGHLRVGASGDARVKVNGAGWGLTPVDHVVSAGSYTVEIDPVGGGAKRTEHVQVHADGRTALYFDLEHGTSKISN